MWPLTAALAAFAGYALAFRTRYLRSRWAWEIPRSLLWPLFIGHCAYIVTAPLRWLA